MKCADCNAGPLDPSRIWREYTGWARPANQRSGQSGSSLVDRQPTGRVICGGCAIKRQHGLNTGQATLG